MKTNVGSVDRILRVVFALALFVVLFVVDSPWRWIGLFGIVPLATALMKSCPLYSIFGISTCKTSTAK
jgi:Inner membrane protein YgaP-like, transmembrane domain